MFCERAFSPDQLPYKEVFVEWGIPFYLLSDVDQYGLPDLYGILNYQVIDCFDVSRPLTLEYRDECLVKSEGRKRHHYNRVSRFRYLLMRLTGRSRVVVPWDVILDVVLDNVCMDPKYIWESVRASLKKNGHQKYYDWIPTIINEIGFPGKIHLQDTLKMMKIVNDFSKMSQAFDEIRPVMEQFDYFPNLKYWCMKLLQHHQVQIDYCIPFIRVKKIWERYEPLWEELVQLIR